MGGLRGLWQGQEPFLSGRLARQRRCYVQRQGSKVRGCLPKRHHAKYLHLQQRQGGQLRLQDQRPRKEYVQVCNGVRNRWPMGLGKYLLLKLEGSMTKKGVLQVDKISEKSGNWVFMNGHAVGLSNKLNDFEGLAVRMGHYEATLAKLTSSLSGKVKKPTAMKYVIPPEYKGD